MPGVFNLSVDEAVREAREAKSLGVPAVILFGLPEKKDEVATGAWAEDGIVQQAHAAIKREVRDWLSMGDVCLCEYMSHGHCGIVRMRAKPPANAGSGRWRRRPRRPRDRIRNRERCHAGNAGQDFGLAGARGHRHYRALRHDGRARGRDPQSARSGRVSPTRRSSLTPPNLLQDSMDHSARPPIRLRSSATAARTRWMAPTCARPCARSNSIIEEGADMIMVKPAMPYLDVIARRPRAL